MKKKTTFDYKLFDYDKNGKNKKVTDFIHAPPLNKLNKKSPGSSGFKVV